MSSGTANNPTPCELPASEFVKTSPSPSCDPERIQAAARTNAGASESTLKSSERSRQTHQMNSARPTRFQVEGEETLLETTSNSSFPLDPCARGFPKSPSKCPLFCCFYAEFDNKVGPKVCFQSPRNFMDRNIDMPIEAVNDILQKALHDMAHHSTSASTDTANSEGQPGSGSSATKQGTDTQTSSTSLKPTQSIFESCGEFIIAGSELTGKIINLSTHGIHVMTRPTVIVDERYERNSLLFCVGLILRRTEDPRPFRSVLSKVSIALRDMERETQFLSNQATRQKIAGILDNVLVSLNHSEWECNAPLNASNILNLRLVNPPKPATPIVSHYAVPIFLRRDWQVQSYEWDLAINWVSMHIDGCSTARQIAEQAEVDLEMVQACLRVLKQHGVIALSDIFSFSNRYEPTAKAKQLLEDNPSKTITLATEYIVKWKQDTAENSPSLNSISSLGDHTHTPDRKLALSSSYPPQQKESSSLGVARFGASSLASTASYEVASQHTQNSRDDIEEVKLAVAELFLACTRELRWSDLWLGLISGARKLAGFDAAFWTKMYRSVDHRRFTSFGVVHGLLNRVHEFPMLLVDENEELSRLENIEARLDGKTCDDELTDLFGLPVDELTERVGCDRVISVFAHR